MGSAREAGRVQQLLEVTDVVILLPDIDAHMDLFHIGRRECQ
jgi:hypothetical protein